MSIRQTRLEFNLSQTRLRGPKLTADEFMARVKRLMGRRMLADGVVEAKSSEVDWNWCNAAGTIGGTVRANTKSEARALIKKQLAGPIPPGYLTIERADANSTGSVSAA